MHTNDAADGLVPSIHVWVLENLFLDRCMSKNVLIFQSRCIQAMPLCKFWLDTSESSQD